MNTHADKNMENKSETFTHNLPQKNVIGKQASYLVDNRPRAIAQMQFKNVAINTPQVNQLKESNVGDQSSIIQQNNQTGLPDQLKSGIENISGLAMDDVKVHYNSDKPQQLQAHAYAQGTDIHVAPGQEKHLPHEAWHVVQQKQGRVKPTVQMKGKVGINDDQGLEKEATTIGEKALTQGSMIRNASGRASSAALKKVNSIQHQQNNETAQLKVIDTQVKGITHLVKLNEEGSLYQTEYTDNEVAEAQPGDTIQIETNNVIRSRRGPNQEAEPGRDQNKKAENQWVNALAFNKRPLPVHTFIREGTFKEKVKSERVEEEGRGSLLLSYNIPVQNGVYLIDASHRGDMYHLRAALALDKRPLIVYNFKAENDLTNYLANAKDVHIYKLPYNPAAPMPDDFVAGRVYRSTEVLSESDATKIIADAPQKTGEISNSMATIPEECINGIDEAVQYVFNGLPTNVALLMYRDSGQTSLVYPELDSGEALPQLAGMMKMKGFTPVFCGAPNTHPDFANIGAYWNVLDSIPNIVRDGIPIDNPKKFKRDIEAEFMKRAFAANKFKIVVGFRSGALDLFTFLGIPTISISLKNIVGEDRHAKFSNDNRWQRTNIQYNIPRNEFTGLKQGRGDSKLFMSPHWKMRTPGVGMPVVAPGALPDKAPAPGAFHPADLDTVNKGLDISISKLVKPSKLSSSASASSSSDVAMESDLNAESQMQLIGHIKGVVTSDDLGMMLPKSLAEIGASVQQENENQIAIRMLLERRMRNSITAFAYKLMQEQELIEPVDRRDAFVKTMSKQIDQFRIQRSAEIELYIANRQKNAGKRQASAGKPSKLVSVSSAKPAPKVAKILSENAQIVLEKIKSVLPSRVDLKDSRNEEEVRALFGMSSAVFFEAFQELAKQKMVKHDKNGPYLI